MKILCTEAVGVGGDRIPLEVWPWILQIHHRQLSTYLFTDFSNASCLLSRLPKEIFKGIC